MATAGFTVRRDRVTDADDWTLEIAADTTARYPIVRELNYGGLGVSSEVPAQLLHYLRRHHRRHGLREVVRVGRPAAPSRRITVVTHDLDGIGRCALEAAAASLTGAGCHREAVSAEHLRDLG